MPTYKLLISYDGTHYSGWQIQPNAPSIQGCLEESLAQLLQKKSRIIGAGRTDAGVHALGQVAHFKSDKECDLKRIQLGLNALLPKDIRVLEISEESSNFHAQISAKGKIYHYHVWREKTVNPFYRFYRTYFPHSLDMELLKKGAEKFVGTHDFTTFANIGSKIRSPLRTITRLEIALQEGGFRLEFEGDGFLYKMVRNIVGTLFDVATSKLSLEEIDLLFQAKDRKKGPIAAPPEGLFLIQVLY